jgi:hypothetical protein
LHPFPANQSRSGVDRVPRSVAAGTGNTAMFTETQIPS